MKIRTGFGVSGVVVAVAFALGCGTGAQGKDEERAAEPSFDGETAPAPPAARAATLAVRTPEGDRSLSVRIVDGRAFFEGDIEIPTTATGVSVIGGRWPNRTVAYAIDPDLPFPERVAEAMAHWEEKTQMRFVPRTNEANYVNFVPGRGCSSPMGRVGGPQSVTLAAGVNIARMVGAEFARADNRAHYWFSNGVHSVGRSSNLDEYEILHAFAVPAGKTAADIVDVAFTPTDDVVAWYADGTYSVGTTEDLGAKQAPLPYLAAANQGALVGVAIDASGRARAWYGNGTTSLGTPANLTAFAAPQAFVLPAATTMTQVLAMAIAADGHAYVWYSSRQASAGSVTDVGNFRALYAVTVPGHCGTAETVHEIGHAIGFYHEQTRADRDQFIRILWSNVSSGTEHNFQLRGPGTEQTAYYDYASIMHYESYAFSSNGQPTITKLDGSTIPYAQVLSPGDIAATAAMYP